MVGQEDIKVAVRLIFAAMINILPFKGIRPTRDKVQLAASRSYVTYSKRNLQQKLDTNPYSFLHIIHPEGAEKLKGIARFMEVRKRFVRFINEGVFLRDEQEAFYLYEQTIEGDVYRGWIGVVSTQDYRDGKIKVHENTLTKREEMFREYLEVTGFHAEPVLLAHKEDVYLRDLANSIARERAEYEFTSADRITHKLWVVKGGTNTQYITDMFAKHECVYIADGHHRSASSALLGRGKAQNDPANFCMAFLLPYNQLNSKPFYRLLKHQSINSIADLSRILDAANLSYRPVVDPDAWNEQDGVLAFDVEGKSVAIQWPEEALPLVEQLPTRQLYRHILRPFGNIIDDRNDKRLQYEPAIQPVSAILPLMKQKRFQLGFLPPPIPFETVMKIADLGETMPPKSTYIEPKLRSGMVVYPLGDI